MRAAPYSLKGAPGLFGVAAIVRDDATAEPPAHCRLVSGHDPKGMVAFMDYISNNKMTGA